MTYSITYTSDKGFDHVVELEGKWQRGEPRTWDYPGTPDEFIPTKVILKGKNIINRICDDLLINILNQLYEQHESKNSIYCEA